MTQFLETSGVAAPGQGADVSSENHWLDEPVPGDTPSGREAGIAMPPRGRPGFIRRGIFFVGWLIQSLFGIASLVMLLALIAAVPVVNFLALGYLLEVEGRVARSGRLRDAFPLIGLAPRLGSIALGIWGWLLPLRFLSNAAVDARLIEPGSRADIGWHAAVWVAAILVALHLCLALARGGSLWQFLRPIGWVWTAMAYPPYWLVTTLWGVVRGRSPARRWRPVKAVRREWRSFLDPQRWQQAEHAIRDFVLGLRLKHHFWLGVRGYVGAMLWLVIPTALFAATNKTEGVPILATLLGGALLMVVLSWVPFLQAHFAAENRWGAMFELRTVRALYRHAPFSWLVTLLVTLTLALPMYLFKIAIPPADALWLVTIVFIVSIYPAKVITGWAYHRAVVRAARTARTPEEVLAAWRATPPAPATGGCASIAAAATEIGTELSGERRAFQVVGELYDFQRYLGRQAADGLTARVIRLASRLVMAPLLALFVFLLFFTQFIGEHGKGVLFEHHAFLLPIPDLLGR
ncbi:MAG: hypothetical protein ACKV0T_06980 [Planctomycetales bacterium]